MSASDPTSGPVGDGGPPATVDPAAERRALRVLLALFLGLATVFIVSSTYQLVVGVYGAPTGAASAGDQARTAPCRQGLARLVVAHDRSYAAAVGERGQGDAVAAFEAGLAPEWQDQAEVEATCARAPGGPDAYTALLRLRLGQERLLRREAAEIAPLRRALDAYDRGPPTPAN